MTSPRYASPTHSSLTRSKPPVHLHERLMTLSTEVDRLRDDFMQGLSVTETLEKNTGHQIEILNGQVAALKTAFVDLSEAVMGQLDQVKTELLTETDTRVANRMETMYASLMRNTESFGRLETRVVTFQQEIMLQIQDLQQKQTLLGKDLSTVKGLFTATSQQIDHLNSDFKAQITNYAASNEYFLPRKGLSQLTDLHLSAVRDSDHTSRKLDILSNELQGYIDSRILTVDKNYGKISDGVEEIKGKLASLGKVLEDSIETIGGDIRSNEGRIGELERSLSQFRTQSNASLAALQQTVAYKQESVSRAIQSLARQVNVPNPLLG